jgi:putative ABC transport system permease protein
VASSAPFDRAFTRQQGAHATASFDAAKVGGADLTATTDRPGVTTAAGPFAAVRAQLGTGSLPLPSGLVVGRADAGGRVDRLELTDGRWLTGPGQIVLSRDLVDEVGEALRVGDRITVEVAGRPSLQLVGVADSVTGTAQAWVWPPQTDILHANGAAVSRQLLYRFAAAGSEAAIRASLRQATTGLPVDALTGASTYLTARRQAEDGIAPMVPFVVAFAVLGLALSVLIVVNVVAGAVVAGYRAIGVHKSLGFTPDQVVGVYAAQILAVCVPACLLGVGLGRLLALLAQTARAYGISGPAMIPSGPTCWY